MFNVTLSSGVPLGNSNVARFRPVRVHEDLVDLSSLKTCQVLLGGAQPVIPPNLYSLYVYEHNSLGSPGKSSAVDILQI